MMQKHGWIAMAARMVVWKAFAGLGLVGAASATPTSAFELIESFDSVRVLIVGDSMAAGALADTSLGQELSGNQISRLQAAQGLHHHYEKTSKEYRDALQRLSVSPAHHAVESTAPWSLGQRLQHDLGRDWGGQFQIANRSIIGATSETLFEQIKAYREEYERGAPRANLVIVNVGGNDWCSETVTPDSFARNMEFRLYQITKDHPRALILVNGVPAVDDIFRIRDTVAFTARGHTVMCKDFEPMLEEECPVGVRMRRSADEALDDELRLKRLEMSGRLEEVVARMARGGGSYPVYAGRMIYLPLDGFSVGPEQVAVDCFHPGQKGHELWADVMWQSILSD